MIRNPIDASLQVSPELSIIIENRVNEADVETPPTLGDIRAYIESILPNALIESERLHQFDADESHLDELDALIEEYGEDAPALEFTRSNASEALTRVIETAINDENQEAPPTLADIRQSLGSGLSNRMVGEGVLEEDEDDTLLEELDFLIERYGPDTPAEELMRYE